MDRPQVDGYRYVICPGWVVSKNDGDRHYIQPQELARLYGVSLFECVELPGREMPASVYTHFARKYASLPKLTPRDDGDYKLPPLIQKDNT